MERVGDEQVQGGTGPRELQASSAVTCSAGIVLETWKPAQERHTRPRPQRQDSDGPPPAQSCTGDSVSALPPVPTVPPRMLSFYTCFLDLTRSHK